MPDIVKPKVRSFQRHLREEVVVVNDVTIAFYRDRKKRRWCWRVFNAYVTLADPLDSGRPINPTNEPKSADK
jgi:hypothetical protein